ncbi:MAG TPA: hypothetical protein VK421_03505 [Pyrinomonadaceae bacterium]|nr:hypothetical protein [Pyrinomonadaceae bacterium]
MPVLWADGRATVPQATRRFPDPRVAHYWDGDGVLVKAYSRSLRIDGPAWDMFLVFDREAEWKGEPPAPAFLMDQIGVEGGRPLDGAAMAAEVRKLLSAPKPQP